MKRLPLIQHGEFEWHLPCSEGMNVPAIIYANEPLIRDMDALAVSQLRDVACLPGIAGAAYAMPDTHSGYGFPIGGVAAFDPARGGVVSMGGVGFDIACGVRTMLTGLTRDDIISRQETLAEALFSAVPSGVGRGGKLILAGDELDAMLYRGAAWAVDQGLGTARDLTRTEEGGYARGAAPEHVSDHAKTRIRDQVGTLGSGNHYLEVQWVESILDPAKAEIFGLRQGDAVVSIHCGSRGLGHQIGTDFLDELAPKKGRNRKRKAAASATLSNRELACAPIHSDAGQRYLGAMQAGINCALANRQVITHLVRQAFDTVFPGSTLSLLYDVCHNTCKIETHEINGRRKTVFVHRKGATRAFGPGHPDIPGEFRETGQPVLVGGSMGSPSYILAGSAQAMQRSFGSACHGAGRVMSRTLAKKRFKGRDVADSLRQNGIFVRSFSSKGIAEEAPDAYKCIDEVVASATGAGLIIPVAKVLPLVCVKG